MCVACHVHSVPRLSAQSSGADEARWLSALFASKASNAVKHSLKDKHSLPASLGLHSVCVYASVCASVCVLSLLEPNVGPNTVEKKTTTETVEWFSPNTDTHIKVLFLMVRWYCSTAVVLWYWRLVLVSTLFRVLGL